MSVTYVFVQVIPVTVGIGNKKVNQSVVVVIAPGSTNGVTGIGNHRISFNGGKGSVTVIMIQMVVFCGEIFSHKKIHITVVIVIGPAGAMTVNSVVHHGAVCYFCKCPVTIVVIEEIFRSHIVCHKQVNIPVVVVIGPGSSQRACLIGYNITRSYFCKCTVTVIVVQIIVVIGIVGSYKQIFIAVVIVIGPGCRPTVNSIGSQA